jgi:endo-alpha-1,4-polygalactosaminidase (GH114 family)
MTIDTLAFHTGRWFVAALFIGACSNHASPGSADSSVVPDAVTQPEAGPEAPAEVGPETPVEAGPEAPAEVGRETPVEVGRETPAEVSRETPAEVGRETPPDVAADSQPPGDTNPEAASSPDTSADGGADSSWPQPMCVWNEAYQENYAADTVAEILAGARGCYVLVDPFANADARAAIAQMKQNRNLVSCYISVGTCEDWRDDFAAMKPYCVSKQWGEWPGEYFIDRTDPALVTLMKARIDKMAGWGCAMVEFDNMDWAFDAANRSQYAITATAAQGEAYNQALCAYAHDKGLGCMAKSSAQGAATFDGLTVESAPDNLDWWNAADMRGMLSSAKIGIVVHYNETDCTAARTTYQTEYGSKLSFICEDRALKKYRHFP